jgi:Zn-dependent protease with chaperone function
MIEARESMERGQVREVTRRRPAGAGALLFLAIALTASPLVAQETQPADDRNGPAPASLFAAAPTGAVAFDPAAATRAYLDRMTPEKRARSDAYFEGGYWLQLWGLLYGLGVAWLLLGSGLSRRMRDWTARIGRRRPLGNWLYGAAYVVISTALTFPLTVYQGFFREHQYDLATQDFPAWFSEQLVGLGVGIALFPLLIVALYGVFRMAPRTWWLWGAAVSVVFLVLVILIAPVYIDPLFNEYKPLADERVKEEILSLARSSGIETDDVWQFDASRQTTRVSANVSGFMGTMRVRLNDNLLNRCTLPEVKAVMGHEIGHYALNHVYESIVFFGVVFVAGFAFLSWAFEGARRRWGGRWGIEGIADIAGLPLLAVVFSVYFFLLTPILNTYIRVNEAEADLYGLQSAREPDGFAEVALKLGEYRKLEPGPFEEWFLYDHPSGKTRIAMAMHWKAEELRRR